MARVAKYAPNTGKILGTPPKDRPLRNGEILAWGGGRFMFLVRRPAIFGHSEVTATGLYELVWDACVETRGDFVGPCERLFEAEKLLGAA